MNEKLLKESIERQKDTFKLVKEYSNLMEQYNIPLHLRPAMAVIIENEKKRTNLFQEVNFSADVSSIEKNIMPMLMRAIPGVIGSEIFGMQPLKADTGVFFYMRNYFTNDSANGIATHANAKYMVLADASAFAVGDSISSTGDAGTGTVRYKEGNRLLVEVATGSFAIGDSVDDAASFATADSTITDYAGAEVAFKVFSEYTKFANIATGEAATTTIKEIEFGIDKETVTAESHKLKMRYTWEMINRMRDYHNLDADGISDVTGATAFAQELNFRIMELVKSYGTTGGTSTWNYSSADGRWELEKYKNLVGHLNRKSSEILKDSKLGMGNYIIIDATTWSALDAMGYIDKSQLPNGMAQPERNPFVGTMLGRYRVYVNIFELSNVITMGYKDFSGQADSEMRAGAFFCPYLPVQSIKTVEQDSGQPVKFFMSQYAFALNPYADVNGGNAFFRRINVSNLPG